MIPTAEVVAYRRASDSGVGESASPRRKGADRAFASCLQANQTPAATAHASQDAASSLVRAGPESARRSGGIGAHCVARTSYSQPNSLINFMATSIHPTQTTR